MRKEARLRPVGCLGETGQCMGWLRRRPPSRQDSRQIPAQPAPPDFLSVPEAVWSRLHGEYGSSDRNICSTRRSGCPVPWVNRRVQSVLCDLDAPGVRHQYLLHGRLRSAHLVSLLARYSSRSQKSNPLTAGRFSFVGLARVSITLADVSIIFALESSRKLTNATAVHSGCAISGLVWLVAFTAQATKEFVEKKQVCIPSQDSGPPIDDFMPYIDFYCHCRSDIFHPHSAHWYRAIRIPQEPQRAS
jgi:hypothetical protein